MLAPSFSHHHVRWNIIYIFFFRCDSSFVTYNGINKFDNCLDRISMKYSRATFSIFKYFQKAWSYYKYLLRKCTFYDQNITHSFLECCFKSNLKERKCKVKFVESHSHQNLAQCTILLYHWIYLYMCVRVHVPFT